MPVAGRSAAPDEAIAELRAFGSHVLRQAWDTTHLARLRAAVMSYHHARAERLRRGELSEGERASHLHGVVFYGGMVAAGIIDWAFLGQLFHGSAYHSLSTAFLGNDTLYARPGRLVLRIHDPRDSSRTYVPYHQDSATQGPLITNVLNCWIPLDSGAGVDRPGLEVVRHPCAPGFPLKDSGEASENELYDRQAIDRSRIVEVYGDNFLAPEFDVGDGLVFTQDVIHRTYVTSEMTQPRINFELRVFSLDHVAPEAREAVQQSSLRFAEPGKPR